MTIEPVRSKRRPVLIAISIAVVVAVVASVVVIALTNFAGQQRRESLALIKDQRLTALVEARGGKIQPAVNAYLAAYKKARNAPASREEAEKNSVKERDEFQQAVISARTALNDVQTGYGAGEEADGIGVAVAQLDDSYQAYLDSMEGLVESYPPVRRPVQGRCRVQRTLCGLQSSQPPGTPNALDSSSCSLPGSRQSTQAVQERLLR